MEYLFIISMCLLGVLFHASELNDQSRHAQINKLVKNEGSDVESELQHRHGKSVANLPHARVSNQLYILQCINRKHPSACCPAAKHPKHNKFWVAKDKEKNQWTFL